MSQPSQVNAVSAPSAMLQDVSSMSSILMGPLNELQALSQTLFLSLSPPQTKPPPPPPLDAFLQCDRVLAQALSTAQTHQIKQRNIETLEKEILDLDTQWRNICEELTKGKKELEELIEEGEERLKAIEQAKKASIPYPELLAYAQSLSAFTSAPPNMPDLNLPSQPPPPLFFPPFPNEEKMRRGHLNAEAPLGSLGETHSVGRPAANTVSPVMNFNQHMGANPYRADRRAPQPQTFDLDLDLNPDL